MKIEGRIFNYIALFMFLVAIMYGVWSTQASGYGIEPIGLVALMLTGGLCLIIGTYFRFIQRRIRPRPEDKEEGETEEGAGEIGFFSPSSYWPVAMAAAAGIVAVALAFWMIWLLIAGIILLLFAVGGLLFEYHIGPNHE